MQEKKTASARAVYNVLPSAFNKAEGVDYSAILAVSVELLAVDTSQKDKARKGIIQGVVSLAKGKGKATGCAIMLDSLLNLTGCSLESQARSFAGRCGVKYQKDDTGRYVVVEWKQPVDANGNPVSEDNLESFLNDLPWKKESKSKDTEVKPIASNGAGLKYFMNEKKASLVKSLKGRNDGSVLKLIETMATDEAFCDKVLALLNDYSADSNKGFFAKIFG